jgi:hypothetical protein
MALLNKLSSFSSFLCGSPFSVTSRLGLRRTWNPSALKFTPSGRFHSAQISRNEPVAQSASDAAEEPVIPHHIWSDTQGERILWVDLADTLEYGVGEVVHGLYFESSYLKKKKEKGKQVRERLKMSTTLRRLVKKDMRKAPSERIDSVVWHTSYGEEPTAQMWRVMDGLSPKHLELFASEEYEDCCIKPLNTLRHQWNDLESLTLRNICEHDFMKDAPEVFSRIFYLTLDHCCGPAYFPPSVTRLKHLRALENDSCDTFCYGIDNVPNLAKVLEVLEIESTNGCDFAYIYYPQDFKDRLRKCTNLREFRLAASYQDSLDTDLASYIPSSVEKLTLQFTRSLPFLHDMGDWTKHASDKTWLPHLKSFQMIIDRESRVGDLEGDEKSSEWTKNLENPPREFSPEAFDMEFEKKRRVLYDVLKSSRPLIDFPGHCLYTLNTRYSSPA